MGVRTIETRTPMATTVVVFEDGEAARPRATLAVAATDPAVTAEAGRLPLGRLGGLAASGVFALWTSLTCFVC